MAKHRLSRITPITLYPPDFEVIDKVSTSLGINRSAAIRVIIRYFDKITKGQVPAPEELIMLGNVNTK